MSASNLRALSDDSLQSRLLALVRRERVTTLDILHHLNEVGRRKLHLTLGHGSLFKYCTERLGYSESPSNATTSRSSIASATALSTRWTGSYPSTARRGGCRTGCARCA